MILLLAAMAAEPAVGVYMPCTAPRHYDGDDIKCTDPAWKALAGNGGMRIAALNAPELDTDEGKVAKATIRDLSANKPVECAWTGTWAPGWKRPRPVVDCRVSGEDLACLMVRHHVATWWPKFDPKGTRQRACKNSFL